jgi:hypothetical protein
MNHTDADAAVISVEWHGPAGNTSPNDPGLSDHADLRRCTTVHSLVR